MICDELSAAILCDYDYSNTPKLQERYVEHYRSLGKLDQRRIMRYRVQEGWTPLCDFLAVPVPDHPFPRLNDSRELQELGQQAWWTAMRNSLRNVLGGAMVVLVTSIALARIRRLPAFV
jgi:Sulfotransferase domain